MRKFGVYASLPYDVKEARASCKDAFETWKQVDFSAESDEHDAYKAKRKDYRLSLRSFLNQLELDRVTKLCSAADSDEKLFWKLLKGQKSSSQISAFLVNGSLITDINEIQNMLTTLKRWEPPRKVLPMIMVLPLKFVPMLRRLLKHVLMTPGVFLTKFLFSEVEHLIDSGTYEPPNQGDTLTIKWKLQSPIAEELYAVGSNDE